MNSRDRAMIIDVCALPWLTAGEKKLSCDARIRVATSLVVVGEGGGKLPQPEPADGVGKIV
jgi:hypothetical protein